MGHYITNSDKKSSFLLEEGESPSKGFSPMPGDEALLPCLFSNISIENPVKSTQIRKSANALSWNVQEFARKFGLENIGFLTLTFRDHVLCVKEAQKRLNSLLSNVIKPRYIDYVGVLERQKSGRIHYHLLVNLGFDIRTGFNFDDVSKKIINQHLINLGLSGLIGERQRLNTDLVELELMPVKSSSEAIGRYVGKYIGKHIECRLEDDKNARLVRYSRGARMCSTRFMFFTDGSAEWRAKVATFAELVSCRTGKPPTFETLREVLGPRWAHNHRDYISELPVLGI